MTMLSLGFSSVRRSWRQLTLIVLLCLSGTAIASDAAVLSAANHTTDLSIKYLNEIFGLVPGALVGSGGGSLLSGLFDVFNKGVMAVAAIWLLYSVAQVLLLSAVSEHPQKSIKNWALWFRMVIGFALLVPTPGSGYCMAQELMMRVVVAGIDLADNTWNTTLNYLEQGHSFFTPPNLQPSGLDSVTKIQDITSQLGNLIGRVNSKANPHSYLYRLYNSEVCMDVSNVLEEQNLKPSQRHIHSMQFVPPVMKDGVTELSTGLINFPGYGDPAGQGNGCGVISLPAQMSERGSMSGNKAMTQTLAQQAFDAMQSSALALQPLANMVANGITNQTDSTSSLDYPLGASSLFQSFYDYYSGLKAVSNEVASAQAGDSSNTKELADFFSNADSEGWFNAGSFYWELVRWSNAQSVGVHGDPNNWPPMASTAVPNAKVQQDLDVADTILNNGIWLGAQQDILQLTAGNSKGNFSSSNQNPVLIPWMFGVISGPLDTLIGKMNTYINSDNIDAYNPLLVSYHIGKYCLGAAGWIWTLTLTIMTPLAFAAGICDSMQPAGLVFKTLSGWAMPLIIAISTMLFAAGAMLVFYVPLYPCLVFLFGVVGWLLYVVEAMVASPLVAFGMTHPEGHDFLGSAQQSLMLALGVFLKPTLMIIGYIISIILVYVVSGFLNMVLGQVFISTFNQSYNATLQGPAAIFYAFAGGGGAPMNYGGFTSNPISDTFCIPIIMVLYGMIMVEVANQCFSAIHQVPDMVLRWIGGPQGNSGGQIMQSMQAVKGAVQSAGKQAGDFAGQVNTSANKSLSGLMQQLHDNNGDNDAGATKQADKGENGGNADIMSGRGNDGGVDGASSASGGSIDGASSASGGAAPIIAG